jgi:hypothetical protein
MSLKIAANTSNAHHSKTNGNNNGTISDMSDQLFLAGRFFYQLSINYPI